MHQKIAHYRELQKLNNENVTSEKFRELNSIYLPNKQPRAREEGAAFSKGENIFKYLQDSQLPSFFILSILIS